MSKRDAMLAIVDKHLDTEKFRQTHWQGSFFDYLDMVVATENRPQRLSADLRHDPAFRHAALFVPQARFRALQLFRRPDRRRARRGVWFGCFADAAGGHVQVGVAGLWLGSPHFAAARPSRFEQEHDRRGC